MRRTLSFTGAAALISGLIVGLSTASSSATPVPKVPKASKVPQRADPVLVVSPGHLHDWHLVTNKAVTPPYSAASSNPSSTASYLFREGPGRPPLGEGSLELATGSASNSRVAVGPLLLAGKPLHSLDRVTYDTYLTQAGTHGAMPIAFKIAVTSTALGHFTTLIFEPARQPGHAPARGEWQAWNALGGHWWATGVTGECSQAHLCTWSQLKSRIGGSSVILISYFELGASGDAQVGAACALDAVVINDPVYDLEAEQPQVPGAGEETPEIPPEEGEAVPGTSEEVPVTG